MTKKCEQCLKSKHEVFGNFLTIKLCSRHDKLLKIKINKVFQYNLYYSFLQGKFKRYINKRLKSKRKYFFFIENVIIFFKLCIYFNSFL